MEMAARMRLARLSITASNVARSFLWRSLPHLARMSPSSSGTLGKCGDFCSSTFRAAISVNFRWSSEMAARPARCGAARIPPRFGNRSKRRRERNSVHLVSLKHELRRLAAAAAGDVFAPRCTVALRGGGGGLAFCEFVILC